MAEEFGLHQGFGNGRAVDGDEGTVLARTFVVDGLGDQVLARAALALNQDRGRLAGSDFLHEVHQFGRLRRHGDHFVIAGVPAHLAAQRLHLAAQVVGLERVLDGDVELFEVQRLADEVVGSEFQGALDVVQLRVGGDHDDGLGVTVLLELFQNLKAVQVRQAHVEQNQVRRLVLCQAQSGLSGGGLDDLVSPLFALLAQRPAHQALVIDHQDFLSRHACLAYYGRDGGAHTGMSGAHSLRLQKPMSAMAILGQLNASATGSAYLVQSGRF